MIIITTPSAVLAVPSLASYTTSLTALHRLVVYSSISLSNDIL